MTDPLVGGLRRQVSARPAGVGDGGAAPRTSDDAPPRNLAEVYARHSGFVWRSVRRMGIPDAAVEDVMHEVFLVVHRRLTEYDGRASMTTWLYHLTRGVVSNWRRGRRREHTRLTLVEPPSAPNGSDPEEAAGRDEAYAIVRGAIAALADDKRLVFELAEIEGLTMPEIAEIAGINLNTAYSRLRLARREFAGELQRLRAGKAVTQ